MYCICVIIVINNLIKRKRILAKNPNWRKYTQKKQQITTKTKCEKEKKII